MSRDNVNITKTTTKNEREWALILALREMWSDSN